jgi:CDP-diacylglycerol---serine O-phosphatidyltransferase
LYGVILVTGYLMVSNRSFMAFKFTDYSVKNNLTKYILLVLSLICIVMLGWLSVPVIFILYLVFSSFSKEPLPLVTDSPKTTLDVTV